MDHPHETSAPVGSNSSQKCSPETGEATPTSWTPSFIHVIDDIFTSMMSATSWSFNSWKYLRDLRESKNHMLHSGFSNHDFNVLQYLFCSSQRLLQGKQPKSRITTKLAPVPQTILEKHHQSRKIIKNHQNSLIQSHPGAWCRDKPTLLMRIPTSKVASFSFTASLAAASKFEKSTLLLGGGNSYPIHPWWIEFWPFVGQVWQVLFWYIFWYIYIMWSLAFISQLLEIFSYYFNTAG